MALLALHNRMRSQQRKSIEVLLDGLHGNLPTQNGVAFRAIRAKLTTVNICVAIRAILANIGKNRLEVAFRAIHFLVQAAQRVFRCVVIEFGHRANRGPTGAGMAILARNGKGTVRTSARLPLPIHRVNGGKRQKKQRHPASDLD